MMSDPFYEESLKFSKSIRHMTHFSTLYVG